MTVLRAMLFWGCLLFALAVYSTAGPLFHLHEVRVEGTGSAVLRPEDVRAGLKDAGEMSLIFGDFDALAASVARHPPVRDVTVHRDFPDAIVISVVARVPVARAADGGLVDANGDWYPGAGGAGLPVFAVHRSRLKQAIDLHDDAIEMFTPVGLGINQMHLVDDGWRLHLANGWVLQLGETRTRSRLLRFANSWDRLPPSMAAAPHLRVDLRVRDGMVVDGLPDAPDLGVAGG